jgi:hypothetical protein
MGKQTWQLWCEGRDTVDVVEGGLSQDQALVLALDLTPEGGDSTFWILGQDGCMVVRREWTIDGYRWIVRSVDTDSRESKPVAVWQTGYHRMGGRLYPWAEMVG